MAKKLSRQDAFELLQKEFIKECKTFYMRDKPEREVNQVVNGVQQCKSLEELVHFIIDEKSCGGDLLSLYATALIEAPTNEEED